LNQHLQHIADILSDADSLSAEQKESILKLLKNADKELTILEFKLDRTEKVKRTTAILLEETIEELEQKRKAIEEAMTELKATQDQLIQQEKLASLGQLTAGIAHEIKNPLNFVNNFSELSMELIEEVREAMRRETGGGGPGNSKSEQNNSSLKKGDKGGCSSSKKQEIPDHDYDPGLILEILDDVEANLRKIHEHGSRADSIVKSMLQHSRGGDGKPEPTNLNALVKEYVNLAFHGMRAGDDPINVDITLDPDESIGDVNLIAEDFSRVILNLVNNSFDAMREKLTGDGRRKTEESLRQPTEGKDGEAVQGDDTPSDYSPKLTVRTKSKGNTVTIEIEDNGPGIPDDIKDKILQPFFTTKKGTQGTGLGLSITNDIIKAHGGELQILSEKNKFTKFIITLSQK
jgi:signal transduction histidine kinase